MMASLATSTFPIHIHNNSKAHSRWPSTAECLPSAHRRQLCCDTFTRKPENTNPDTCRLSCDSSDGRVLGGRAYVSADEIPEPGKIHLHHSRASTALHGRDVQLSQGPRKRYLMGSFLAGSIPVRLLSVGSSDFHGITGKSHAMRERIQKAALSPPQAAFHVEVYRAWTFTDRQCCFQISVLVY